LTRQFTERSVSKKYVLLTDHPFSSADFTVRSRLVRAGEKYISRSDGSGVEAETHFHVLKSVRTGHTLVQAVPVTGRTHQIRAQASSGGFPVLGDTAYGGPPFQRVCLHAAELKLSHPATGSPLRFAVEPDFEMSPPTALREGLFDPELTDGCRLIHGGSDRWPGWYIDRFGAYLVLTSEDNARLEPSQQKALEWWSARYRLSGIYHKHLSRQPVKDDKSKASAKLLSGQAVPEECVVRENGLRFVIRFNEGYSVGLFLDQRDNRRRLLNNHVAAGFAPGGAALKSAQVLNLFAYTCGFSVCAATAGACVTSVDLSRKYLEWGKDNFRLNGIDPVAHDFLYGDVFDWIRRLTRKRRTFDVILVDPPTFSRSREQGTFQVERDYGRLITLCLALLKANGVLMASTNAGGFKPEDFVAGVLTAARSAGRAVLQHQYFPQPPDFPVSRGEPAYLKTIWLRLD
jgi:23S rRNA (cytosine1962-C5)-methyltransferase